MVLPDNGSVREFLGEGHEASEIATFAAEGIRREGLRCLGTVFEAEEDFLRKAELCGANWRNVIPSSLFCGLVQCFTV
jgi:hypothetical protein